MSIKTLPVAGSVIEKLWSFVFIVLFMFVFLQTPLGSLSGFEKPDSSRYSKIKKKLFEELYTKIYS